MWDDRLIHNVWLYMDSREVHDRPFIPQNRGLFWTFGLYAYPFFGGMQVVMKKKSKLKSLYCIQWAEMDFQKGKP